MKHTIGLFLLLLCLCSQSLLAKPLTLRVDSISLTQDTAARKTRFLPVPIVQYLPETSLILGVSTLYTFYADKKDIQTRPSFLFVTGFYTLKKQLIFDAYVNGWTKQNKLHYMTEISYFKANYKYYGVGSHTLASNEIVNYYIRRDALVVLEKKASNKSYVGIELNFRDERQTIPTERKGLTSQDFVGEPGAQMARIGISYAYDTRDVYTSARTGSYYKLTTSQFLPILGSPLSLFQLKGETRNFFTLKPKHVLGLNSNFETIQGGRIPFYLMSQMGTVFLQRGYYPGRYRDQNYIGTQAEYRWTFYKRWGVVGFLGAGEVFNNTGMYIEDVKPSWGLGLRYLYDEASRINFRVEYGWGEKVAGEDRMGSWYFYIGEAF